MTCQQTGHIINIEIEKGLGRAEAGKRRGATVARGRKGGRKRKIPCELEWWVLQAVGEGRTLVQVAGTLGVSVRTVQRVLERARQRGEIEFRLRGRPVRSPSAKARRMRCERAFEKISEFMKRRDSVGGRILTRAVQILLERGENLAVLDGKNGLLSYLPHPVPACGGRKVRVAEALYAADVEVHTMLANARRVLDPDAAEKFVRLVREADKLRVRAEKEKSREIDDPLLALADEAVDLVEERVRELERKVQELEAEALEVAVSLLSSANQHLLMGSVVLNAGDFFVQAQEARLEAVSWAELMEGTYLVDPPERPAADEPPGDPAAVLRSCVNAHEELLSRFEVFQGKRALVLRMRT